MAVQERAPLGHRAQFKAEILLLIHDKHLAHEGLRLPLDPGSLIFGAFRMVVVARHHVDLAALGVGQHLDRGAELIRERSFLAIRHRQEHIDGKDLAGYSITRGHGDALLQLRKPGERGRLREDGIGRSRARDREVVQLE